ncbi:MAG: hypothetical protein AB8G05_26580 [Oligoflexales bacterium]
MKATIRLCARLFKKAKTQVSRVGQKSLKTFQKVCKITRKRVVQTKSKLWSFFANFRKPKQEKKQKALGARDIPVKFPKPSKPNFLGQIDFPKTLKQTINAEKVEKKFTPLEFQDFYTEWKECFGPTLNSIDKKYLEAASPEQAEKIMYNARLMLKSPYLKAVYNGLKDLEDIDDLLINDVQAKANVRCTFARYYEMGPEYFCKMLDIMHDKGVYPTRSGERRLALDQRLIPQWLGLVG